MTESVDAIRAVYAGSFDPVTHGHLDIVRRASGLFNELVVGVGVNPEKRSLFSSAERVSMILPHIANLSNVRVEAYDGLTIDFARRMGARVLLRGIRNIADFSEELMQANLNRAIGQIETVFLLASETHALTSSTYIRQIYELGGGDRRQVEHLVPSDVAEALAAKLGGPHSGAGGRP